MKNDKTNKPVNKDYNAVSAKQDTTQPQEGQKNDKGQFYSNLYGGYVPGLYAQGR